MRRVNINGRCTVHNNEKCELPAAPAVYTPKEACSGCNPAVNKSFLADRTNGRAIATLLRLSSSSSVVCDVMYCG